jgi:hypothetical protein
MKAILEFNLPEDRNDFEIAAKAMDWSLVLWDVDQQLRSWEKYGNEFQSAGDALEAARICLREKLDERGLNLNMIL